MTYIVYLLLFFGASSFNKEEKKDKFTLIFFSGSDWCLNCIRFKKNIADEPAFKKLIKKEVNYIVADFPQAEILSDETYENNSRLAEKYNPKGIFPLFVLIPPNNKNPIYIKYTNQSAITFVSTIKTEMTE